MKNTRRGSVLLASLIIALIIAMACGSYAALVLSERRESLQTIKLNSALNLAEAGIEEAMWAINNKILADSTLRNTHKWNALGSSTTVFTKSVSGGKLDTLGMADRGSFKVRVDLTASGAPVIVSEGKVEHAGVPTVTKQIKVTLKSVGGFVWGFVFKGQLIMNNSEFASYNPVLGNHNDSNGQGKGPYNHGDKGGIVSLESTVEIQNADVYGTLGTGSTSTAAGDKRYGNVSWTQGTLSSSTTAAGVKVDTKLIKTGVQFDFPKPRAIPSNSKNDGTNGTNLFKDGSDVGTLTANKENILGDPAATSPTYYYLYDNRDNRTASQENFRTLALTGNTSIRVAGPVVLVVGEIDFRGTAGITIDANSNAKLELVVCRGQLKLTGNAIANETAKAEKLMIYGTGGQFEVSLNGNATVTGILVAPEWRVNFNGSSKWQGAMIAGSANFSANGDGVYYDESLSNLKASGSTGFKVDTWVELNKPAGSLASYYARDNSAPFN